MTATDADRRRSQRLVVVAAVGACVFLAAVAVTVVLLRRDPAPRAAARAEPSPHVSNGPTAGPDISWTKTLGVELPSSRTHGPRTVTTTTASGFSSSELGAAIAAVHVLIRSSAAAGPDAFEPTITQQVTGANAAAMKLLVAQQYEQLRAEKGVVEGESVTGDAEVLGYLIDTFVPGGTAAKVQVFLDSPALSAQGQLLRFTVQLLRRNDDWAVVAPPRGDWGAATTVLSEPPAGMISYGDKP